MFYDQHLNDWLFCLVQHQSFPPLLPKISIPLWHIHTIPLVSPLFYSHSHLPCSTSLSLPLVLICGLASFLAISFRCHLISIEYILMSIFYFTGALSCHYLKKRRKKPQMNNRSDYKTSLETSHKTRLVRWEGRDKVLLFNRTQFPTN